MLQPSIVGTWYYSSRVSFLVRVAFSDNGPAYAIPNGVVLRIRVG